MARRPRLSFRTLSIALTTGLLALLTPGTVAQEGVRWRGAAPTASGQPARRSTAALRRAELAQVVGRGERHCVVQFERGLTAHDRAVLEQHGLRVLNPLGAGAYFAAVVPGRLDAEAVAGFRGLADVRAIQPQHRLHPRLALGEIPDWARVGVGADRAPLVAAYVVLQPDVATERGRALVQSYGGRVVDALESVDVLVVEMPEAALLAMSEADEIQWIEPPLPRFDDLNDSSRAAIQADEAQAAPYGLSGAGVTVLVYDGGTGRASHLDFGGRLTVRDASGLSSHATHVAGTVGGDGAASGGVNRGMAPAVTIESYGFQYDGTGIFLYTNPGDIESDYGQAISTFGVDIANNSIGTNTETNGFPCNIQGDYGVTSSLIDAIVRGSLGSPFRIVWANGNERQGSACDIEGFGDFYSTAPPATAKNHITVGALNSNDGSMTSFSSWGPTDDGRIKPDISGPGCQAGGDGGVTSVGSASDTSYSVACGTSMAAPAVTGALALLLEDFRARFPAQPDPRNSTLKVLLAQTATDRGNPGPDYQYGYGEVAIREAIDFMRLASFREDSVDHQGGSWRYTVTVGAGEDLRLTLAWDDAPGTPNVFGALVNDLDLVVTDPSGTRHYPWTLDPLSPGTAAVQTAADHVNNVEQVDVSGAQAGDWLVEVRAHELPEGPQTFSLASSHALAAGPAVSIGFVAELPTRLTPGVAHTVTAQVVGIADSVVAGSPTLHVRYDGGAYLALPMAPLGGDLYTADLPPAVCAATPEFWFSAEGAASGTTTSPAGAPAAAYQASVRTVTTLFADDVESDLGWSVVNENLLDGPWERGVPAGLGDRCDPAADLDGSGRCWLTDNVAGNSDIDGGPTRLSSPVLDLSGASDPTVRYARWFCSNVFDIDRLTVEISDDGGASWVTVESVGDTGGWTTHAFRVADFVALTANVVVRFSAADQPNDSVAEAALDAFAVLDDDCAALLDDCNENGILDADDVASGRSADVNANGVPDECESTDCDGDGVPDELEPDCDADGVPDDCEADCDGSGIPDDCEGLADCNANGTPDVCEAFTDCNANGVPDDCEPDCDLDGVPDDCEVDCDGNGIPDDCETQADCNGNGTPDVCEAFTDCNANGIPDECEPDCDGDGVPDDCEADCDLDGTPDDCEVDCNGNGVPDDCEALADCNANGIPDVCESFADCNANGIPDECEPDCDTDGIPDDCEQDCNGNGTPDDCEGLTDCDGNGIPDECEAFADCNSNGIPDACDPDCDADGIPDDCEVDCNANGVPDDCESLADCNANGIPDACETFADCNANGIPDECETDCDADGIPDDCEADCDLDGVPDDCEVDCNGNGTPDDCEALPDCNANGVPDECEALADCNANGIPDECETFADCNANAVPDECEPDCDADGIPDDCEVDCNGNGTPDDCETLADCNANGIPDECEAFQDCNGNGIPDACDPDANGNGVPDDCEGTTDTVASGETAVRGTVTGTFALTQAGDGVYQSLLEEQSNGNPARKRSRLEHVWTFDVPAGNSQTFLVRAHHSPSSDGDDFVLAWSTDGATYTDMLTVTKTADDGSYQDASLPPGVSGTLFVRVLDTDQTQGNSTQDTLFVDHMFVQTSTAPTPPASPGALTATAVSSTRIEVTWNDNSADEDGFEVERSSDGVTFAPHATVGADVQGYSDAGLAPEATWFYRVRAFNAIGSSDPSNVDSATTLPAGISDALADGETLVDGTVSAGSFTDTHAADGVTEDLLESRTGGPPDSRVSSLEHVWTFEVQGGDAVSLHVLAQHTLNPEGDDFVFAWSTDGVNYTDALTVTKVADDGVPQVAALPASLSGTVWIRVRDTDRTVGNGRRDTLSVDQLFIRSQ